MTTYGLLIETDGEIEAIEDDGRNWTKSLRIWEKSLEGPGFAMIISLDCYFDKIVTKVFFEISNYRKRKTIQKTF